MTEKVLILGCGDLGQRLAQQLAPQGYKVTGVRRSPCANLPYLTYRQADARQRDQLAPLLTEGFAVIVITMTPAERTDSGYQKAYVNSCQTLIDCLNSGRCPKPRLLLFVSSTAVYGQHDGSWIDETSTTDPQSFSGKRLLEAEQLIRLSGFPHSIIRFSGIYGPGRYRLIEQVRQKRASASEHFTNRIHADDCAGVLAHLIQLNQPLAPVYLASDSQPTPMVDVVSWIAAQLGVSTFLSADAVNERGNKRISNQRLGASGYQLRYPDFKTGYRELIAEYQARYPSRGAKPD